MLFKRLQVGKAAISNDVNEGGPMLQICEESPVEAANCSVIFRLRKMERGWSDRLSGSQLRHSLLAAPEAILWQKHSFMN